MIHSVTITNHLAEAITMELRSPENSGFFIRSIEGLGPTKAEISLSDYSVIDGSLYNIARAERRNIVFSLGFLPNPDIETSRQLSYKYFPLKKRIKVKITTDNREVEVYGYVESNEPNIFDSQSGCIISVLCPDAYLFDTESVINTFSALTPLFSFPFSNESLVAKLLVFGDIEQTLEKTTIYTGEVDTGMTMYIHASGSASDFVLTKSTTLQTFVIDSDKLIAITGFDIIASDDIIINTTRGHKSAILIRGGITTNIIGAITENSTWFQLEKGDNVFAYSATNVQNLQFEIRNNIAYEGI